MSINNLKQYHQQVLVIGAGPVGLSAALALRKRGISATILEAEPEDRTRPGSRAIFVHKATLKHFEDICPTLGFTLAENGVIWPVKRTLFRGEEVYVREYNTPSPSKLPPLTSLPQLEIERFLYQACVDAGVEFVWDTPVKDVETDDYGVTLTTESGTAWTADYIIGADGARSSVRKSVGIEMEGPRSNNSFLVVDVEEDPDDPLPLERVFHYQHPAVGERNVLFVPFAGGWRVDLQLFEDDDPAAFSGTDGVRKWLPKVMDAKYADRITWVSTYQFYQVVAKNYTDAHQRVLLVGEAAHLFAPFGARGMNSGIADAVSSAEAIHQAISTDHNASANQAILKTAEERQIAGQYNRDCARIALEHLQGTSERMKMRREVAAFLAPHVPSLGKWLDEAPYGPKSGPPTVASKY